jgi:membrane protein DedA with SNARE-associated domain
VGGLVFLVPVLLVVVAGYSVGYVVAEALGVGEPEAVGWPAGFLLLAVTVVALLRYRRRRRRRTRGLPAPGPPRSSPPSSGPPSRRR